MATGYLTYQIRLEDLWRDAPQAETVTGGGFLVVAAGAATKVTLYDPDNSFQALANPLTFTKGQVRFATLTTVLSVDLYGFTPTGQSFIVRGCKPSSEPEYKTISDMAFGVAVLPVAAVDYAPGAERTTGLQVPVGTILQPNVGLRVLTAEVSRTLSVGMLASETGGNATGILNGISVGTAGSVVPSSAAAGPTLGALLFTAVATTPVVNLWTPQALVSTSRTLSATSSASSASYQALVYLPYMRSPV